MTIQRFHTNERMSQIVVHGDTVYLAGQVAWKNRGKSIAEQTQEILSAIDGYLAEVGSDKHHLLSANIWLTDVASQFADFNAAWEAWLPQGQAPVRACVESPLVAPDFHVEVAVIAVKKRN
ncbi:MAG: RidA family protein [Rhodospirillales bacterium]|nr:RidA family protein [Rhodospirillales bacterium]